MHVRSCPILLSPNRFSGPFSLVCQLDRIVPASSPVPIYTDNSRNLPTSAMDVTENIAFRDGVGRA